MPGLLPRDRKRPRKGERKFIPRRTMSTIRWDVAVANRQLKAAGKQDVEYVSLHAWGCGCCFLTPVRRLPPPSQETDEQRKAREDRAAIDRIVAALPRREPGFRTP